MSGIMRYNPQSQTYVRQGPDGKFAPKVLGRSSGKGQPTQVQTHPAGRQSPPKVFNSK